MHAYGAGFKRAVFSAASVAQWESANANADASKYPGDNSMLPNFVKMVYPDGGIPIFCDFLDYPKDARKKSSIVIWWWRHPRLGVEIGGFVSTYDYPLNRTVVSPKVSIIVFR
jgi:hypothetical protein